MEEADNSEVQDLQDQLSSVSISDERDDARGGDTTTRSSSTPGSDERGECAVCLLQCTLPLCLPCGHTFCYLCAKGIAFRSRRCALCRQPIPDEVIARPQIDSKQVEPVSLPRVDTTSHHQTHGVTDGTATGSAAGPHEDAEVARHGDSAAGGAGDATDDIGVWYYEGHNGWWQYEPRTNAEIEKAYRAEEKACEVLIAGFVYHIDLENMHQARYSQNTRRRRIRRNLSPDAVRKGVAGVPFSGSAASSSSSTRTGTSADTSSGAGTDPGTGGSDSQHADT